MPPLFARRELVHHISEIAKVSAHHGGKDGEENQQADENRQRHADEINLHLRHQATQHAKPQIEDQTEHKERRRNLDRDFEGGREGARGERCGIADPRAR